MLERLCVIANGFQEDYMINYLNCISNKVKRIDFIGSSIYPREKIHASINFHDLQGGGLENLSALAKIKRVFTYYTSLIRYMARKPRRGVVHIQWLRFKWLDGIFLPLLYRILGYKNTYTVHDIVPHDKDTFLNRVVFKIIYKLNWKLIVHTEFLKQRLCSEFNIKPEKVKVIHHGVYEVADENLKQSPADAKKSLGLQADDQLFLFFGYITQYKGLDLLLKAFTEMNTNKPAHVIIAGRPYESYKAKLDELMKTYSQDNIRFIIRRIEDDEVSQLFNACDLAVLPYREASQSGVLFMSYAHGVPVIAPNIGGFPYDVIDKKTGFLFAMNDSDDLKKQLESFVQKSNTAELYTREALRNYARENYSWEKSGIELVQFFNEKS